ncbi:MAG TPA: adenylate/guanylate cyclase domain-containing protein, partial [Chthonomonadaceae bacterium]|nr:adenylate/guanylate cyclase domain-containing protein [Chthonomonadaceae bacterium]
MSELPSGTVTFLFTDIEGSTRLWEKFPEAMRQALARHDALLREAIENNNGHLVKSTGDGLLAVFATAPETLQAAFSAQQALHQERFEQIGSLQVRMALHTGAAEERDNDYFGPALNRAARLLAIGHGEQVLLSMPAEELVKGNLPEGCALRDMGSHRLKDLSQPEHVFQLIHPDLPSEFPPLRSLQAFANNLPMQLTSFIGREKESE